MTKISKKKHQKLNPKIVERIRLEEQIHTKKSNIYKLCQKKPKKKKENEN